MRKAKLIVISGIAVLLAVSAVYAEPECKGGPGGPGQKREEVFKELNLTPEQEKKIDENHLAQEEQMLKLHKEMKAEQEKLREALKNPAVTRAAVGPTVNKIKLLQAQLIENRINGIFAVKKILTPEQYVKFNQIMEDAKHRIDERLKKKWREGHPDRKPGMMF